MGRAKRVKPVRLGEKLCKIRESLNLTLEGLIESLDYPDIPLYPASISLYEAGKREPPLLVLLRYARLGKVAMEILVDDGLELPRRFEK